MSARHVIVGAGAQGRVVLETWRAMDPDAEFLFVDDAPAAQGTEVLGARVAGPLASLPELGGDVVVALGHNELRLRLGAELAAKGVLFGRAIHPSAVVSPTATIGPGTVVLPRAVVHTAASLGRHVIVNTGVVVEHDCVLEDGASVSPGACMAGRVRVGRAAFVSAGVTLAPRVTVGAGSVVGAGAAVVSDLPEGVLAYGVPARVVRRLADGFDFRTLL